tara:strand:- start:2547 stop:3143 length:597 start_codon:yes stop_codon:yes gene_type:complete
MNIEPPGGAGGGGGEPLAILRLRSGKGMKVSLVFSQFHLYSEMRTFLREVQTRAGTGMFMRKKQPLTVEATWRYPLPMPMPGQPVCATEFEAVSQLERLPKPPRMFLWTDTERKCPEDWGFIASVRQGIPPQGIEAELLAWADQYRNAWLAVDLRDGVIPPSTVTPMEELLSSLKRPVIILVSRSPEHEDWPQWVLPA